MWKHSFCGFQKPLINLHSLHSYLFANKLFLTLFSTTYSATRLSLEFSTPIPEFYRNRNFEFWIKQTIVLFAYFDNNLFIMSKI